MSACATPISTLAINVANRLEENEPPIFWSLQFELYSALVEAMNDLMLLVGRPLQAVTQPLTLVANTVWQTVPKGIFLISNLYGVGGEIRQVGLASMDFIQASWDGTWENDTAQYPQRWLPVGVNMFAVHPAPLSPIQVTMTGIQYPALDPFPYTGNEQVPFTDEFHVALEEYAVGYCALKELGAEANQGFVNYQAYLGMAQRLTQLSDRRDPNIFSKSLGIPNTVSPTTKR
jgi:hypothetical protein